MKTIKDKYLVVGADFAGFPLKEVVVEHLQKKGWKITDLGVTKDSDPNDTLEISAYNGDPYSGSFVHTDASGTTQIGDIALFAEEKPDGSVSYWYYFYLDADTVWTGYCIPEQVEDQMAMGQGGDPLYVRVP